MAERVLTISELTVPGFIESISGEMGDCKIVMDNNETVVLPLRLAMINGIFWRVHKKFNVPVVKEHIFWIDTFTDETTNKCGTAVYREFVLNRKLPHLDVLGALWVTINQIFKFVHRNCREYQLSIDALSLDRMCMQAPMKEVCTREIDESLGTLAGERAHAKITSDLYKILLDPNALEFNPLQQFMRVGLLKKNQLPQMFCAYGPRSDINDDMMKHVINSNAFSGLTGVEDFATEYLSAKKAQYFNNAVIRKAQYFARRMRLGASRIPNIYPGSCGSTFTLPVTIPEKHKFNYLGKYIKVTPEEFEKYDDEKVHLFDDCSIALTKKNIDHFVGREIHMWSPFGCRYTDGICEHCAGFMNQHAIAFIPPGIQVGVYCATKLASVVTQKILSAKHLIKTSSKEFMLNQVALKYFSKNSDVLLWQASAIKMLQKSFVRVEVSGIGPISDLKSSSLQSGESWSVIDHVQIVGPHGNLIDDVVITDGTTHPYFSNYAMSYMRDHYDELVTSHSEFVDIPMKDFDFHRPMLKFTAVNDDMVSYVTGVDKFLCSKICDYRSIGKCMQDFSTMVYSKADISIFYIELMLRAFLVTSGGKNHSIPVLTDPNQMVEFDKMSSMISESALSTKLSFERLEELFDHAEPTLYDLGAGYGFNDSHFGFVKE